MQSLLISKNPSWAELSSEHVPSYTRPDGDAELNQGKPYDTFNVPPCPNCNSGILKPEVVFFGENVPSSIVKFAMDRVTESDGILVCGTSLMVYSAFRFVKAAVEHKIPVGVVNIGPTRADDVISFKVEGRCSEILPMLYSQS